MKRILYFFIGIYVLLDQKFCFDADKIEKHFYQISTIGVDVLKGIVIGAAFYIIIVFILLMGVN